MKPVARTVIRTAPSMRGSTTAPKMTFASAESVRSRIKSIATFSSDIFKSRPAVMFANTLRAPLMSVSRSGELTAIFAASSARFSPSANPMPISAVPAFDMTALTSAKSTLIRPGMVMMSEIPATPCRRTSSASLNASSMDTSLPTTVSKRSFGMMIIVSTLARSASMPFSAA